MFANSPSETKTDTEKEFVAGWAKQIGDIGRSCSWIVATAIFMILLVTGNTMAQAIRERTSELAVLKTLGFGDGRILPMVLLESVLLAAGRRRAGPGDVLRLHHRSAAIRRTGSCRRSTSRPLR